MLTLYTILMLSHGYTPGFPKRRLVGGWLDKGLAVVGVCGTLASTVYTMVRCRRRWAFVFMAIWKLSLSVSLNAMVFHAAHLRTGSRDTSTLVISRWTWLWHRSGVWSRRAVRSGLCEPWLFRVGHAACAGHLSRYLAIYCAWLLGLHACLMVAYNVDILVQ